jgi:hypothetical protein
VSVYRVDVAKLQLALKLTLTIQWQLLLGKPTIEGIASE